MLSAVLIAAAVIAIGGALAVQLTQARNLDLSLRPGWLAAAVVGLVASQLGQAELYQRLLAALGAELPGLRARAIWNITLLGRYVPTGALQVVGRLSLGERAGVPRRVSAAAFGYELVLSVAATASLSAFFIIRLPVLADRPLRWTVLAVPLLLLAALQPKVTASLSGRVLTRLRRPGLPFTVRGRDVGVFALGYLTCFSIAGLGLFALTRALYPIAHLTSAPRERGLLLRLRCCAGRLPASRRPRRP